MTPVSVNGVAVANADIAREVQHQRGDTPLVAWKAATRALVVRELLRQRATELGLEPVAEVADGVRESDEEALLRALLEHELRLPSADEETCRRFHARQRGRIGAMPFEQARPLIAAYLEEASWRQAAAQYLQMLASQAQITGCELGRMDA